MSFKRFLILSSGCPHVWWSGTIDAILAKGIIYGEHLSEIILNLDQWFRRCHLKKKFTAECRTKTDHNSSSELKIEVQSQDIIMRHFVTLPFKTEHFQIFCKNYHDKVNGCNLLT